MSNHTPGPWFPATGWVGKGDLQHPQVICRVENFPYGPTEANVCLIAAAPELLDALKKALAELNSYWQDDYLGRSLPPVILAAIAKAEGR